MAGHSNIEYARTLLDAPIAEYNTEQFLNLINTHYPNGSWEDDPEMNAIVLSFHERLQGVNAEWATQARLTINSSRGAREELSTTVTSSEVLRPQARPYTIVGSSEAPQPRPVIYDGLDRIGMDQSTAFEIMKTVTGENRITSEVVEKFQDDAKIEDDGLVGPQTIKEAQSLILRGVVQSDFRNGSISLETQQKVREVLGYTNSYGEYSRELITFNLLVLRQIEENEPRHEELYGNYILFLNEQTESAVEAANNDPGAEAAAVATVTTVNPETGTSFGEDLGRVFDGELGFGEVLQRHKGPLLFVSIAAFIFFGNKIPGIGDLPGMDKWYFRIGYVLGGAYLGLDDLAAWGIDRVGDGVEATTNYLRSPEAQAAYDSTRQRVSNYLSETFPELADRVGEVFESGYDSLVTGFEGANNRLSEDHADFIPDIAEKGLAIIGDEKFFNTSKDSISEVIRGADPSAIFNRTTLEELERLGMSDEEIRKFLRLYIVDTFEEGHELFRDTLIATQALDRARDAVDSFRGSYIDNPRLNQKIVNQLSPLTNAVNPSPAFRQAVTEINRAAQSQNMSNFNIGNHPELTSEEEDRLSRVTATLRVIFEQEAIVLEQIRKIQDIQIVSDGATPDTVESLQEKLNFVISVQQNIDEALIDVTSGVETTDFSVGEFVNVKQSKEEELTNKIIELASVRGLTEVDIAGVIVNIEEYQRAQDEERIREAEERENEEKRELIGTLITNFEEIPNDIESIEDIRTYLENNVDVIANLRTKLSDYEGSSDPVEQELHTEVQETLSRLERLLPIYTTLRQQIIQDANDLKSRIEAVHEGTESLSTTEYSSESRDISNLYDQYKSLLNEVHVGIDISSTFRDIESFFTNGRQGNIPDEANTIDYIDRILLGEDGSFEGTMQAIELALTTERGEIEQALDTRVEIPANITQSSVVFAETIEALKSKQEVVQSFTTAIKEQKIDEIRSQALEIRTKFLDAINRADSVEELTRVYNLYKGLEGEIDELSDIQRSYWEEMLENIGIDESEDPVEVAYKEKLRDITINPILDLDVRSPEARQIFEIFSTGVQDHPENDKIRELVADLQSDDQISVGELIRVLENEIQAYPELENILGPILENIQEILPTIQVN